MAVGPRLVDGEKRFDRSRKEREKQTRRQLDSFDFIPGHPRLTNQPLLTSRGCRPLSPRTRGRMWTNFHQYFIIISSFAFSAVLIFMWPSISRPSAQQPFSRCHVATSTGAPSTAATTPRAKRSRPPCKSAWTECTGRRNGGTGCLSHSLLLLTREMVSCPHTLFCRQEGIVGRSFRIFCMETNRRTERSPRRVDRGRVLL